LSEILNTSDADKTSIRFSFSKYTTKQEIDVVLEYIESNFKSA